MGGKNSARILGDKLWISLGREVAMVRRRATTQCILAWGEGADPQGVSGSWYGYLRE